MGQRIPVTRYSLADLRGFRVYPPSEQKIIRDVISGVGDLRLLPDDEPRARHRRAIGRGRATAYLRGRAWPLCRLHQRVEPLDRTPLARPLQVVSMDEDHLGTPSANC